MFKIRWGINVYIILFDLRHTIKCNIPVIEVMIINKKPNMPVDSIVCKNLAQYNTCISPIKVMKRKNLVLLLSAILLTSLNSEACTNFLITKGASADDAEEAADDGERDLSTA